MQHRDWSAVRRTCRSAAVAAVAVMTASAVPTASAQVPPTLTVTDASVVEGNTGTTTLTFRYSLDRTTSTPVTGAIEVIPLTGAAFRPAIGFKDCGNTGVDYKVLGGTLLMMQPNLNQPPEGAVSVTVCGDIYSEPDEHIFIRFSGVQGAQCFEGTCDGIGTIRNDGDTTRMPPSTLSVNDPVVTEPLTGTRSISFKISLGSANFDPIEVQYRTVDGSARAIGPGSGPWNCPLIDYFSKNGQHTFQRGEVEKTVTTNVCGGDSTSESSETFKLLLENATGTQVDDPVGVATIRNFQPRLTP